MLHFKQNCFRRSFEYGAVAILLLAVAGCSHDRRDQAAAQDAKVAASGKQAAAEPAIAPATADAALMAVLRGLSTNQPDSVWDALPASYQKDVDELLGEFASRLHPEAWRWFAQIAGKSRGLLPADDEDSGIREPATRLLEWLASGKPVDLQQLSHTDLGSILRTRGRNVMADVRRLLEPLFKDPDFEKGLRDLLGPIPDVFRDPSLLKLNVKDLDGDECTVEIQLPVDAEVLAELYRVDVRFVRVEGKWIPAWLAENWTDLIAAAHDVIAEILPADRAEDNFGFVFQYLGQLETMIEFELAAAEGETIIQPTLYDLIDELRALAEDLELPLPAPLRAPEVPIPSEAGENEAMEEEPRSAEREGKELHE
jgi:hypothetical protein